MGGRPRLCGHGVGDSALFRALWVETDVEGIDATDVAPRGHTPWHRLRIGIARDCEAKARTRQACVLLVTDRCIAHRPIERLRQDGRDISHHANPRPNGCRKARGSPVQAMRAHWTSAANASSCVVSCLRALRAVNRAGPQDSLCWKVGQILGCEPQSCLIIWDIHFRY